MGRKGGNTTFAVDAAGNAIFKGDITGSNGNFAGNLNGANITGATGTFTGSLQAGTLDIAQLVGQSFTYTYYPGLYYYPTAGAGFTKMRVTLVGGGGGGGSYYGGGGGGGGLYIGTFDITPGTTFTVIVGAGGSSGVAGSATIVNGYASAGGGGGGGYTSGGSGGSGTTYGSNGTNYYIVDTGGYYDSKYGGYVPAYTPIGGNGGNSGANYGTGGLGRQYGYGGNLGNYYGGGGGGTIGNGYGGAGASGVAIIEFFNPNGVIIRSEWAALISALNRQGIQTT